MKDHTGDFLNLVRTVIETGSVKKGTKTGEHVKDMRRSLENLEGTMLRSWGELDQAEASLVLLQLQSIATSATRAAESVLEATGTSLTVVRSPQ